MSWPDWLQGITFDPAMDNDGTTWHDEHQLPNPHRTERWVTLMEMAGIGLLTISVAMALLLATGGHWFGTVVLSGVAVFCWGVVELAKREDQRSRSRH